MKIFALGFCSITLGVAGMAFLPAYFWVFVFCVASGLLCQLVEFWQAHREHTVAIRQLEEHDQWQADIQRRYAEIDEADGEKKVELIKEILNRLESMGGAKVDGFPF